MGLRHVTRVTKTAVYLTDGTELPLGKGLYDKIALERTRMRQGEDIVVAHVHLVILDIDIARSRAVPDLTHAPKAVLDGV